MYDYTYQKLLGYNVPEHNLTHKNLAEINLSQRNLVAIDLKNYILHKTNFEQAELMGADLRGLIFSSANCVGTNFSGSDLRGANLAFSYFHNADFRGADLRGTYLIDALCNEVNFAGADLRGAHFGIGHYDSDFRGADLRGIEMPENESSFRKMNCDIRSALVTPKEVIKSNHQRKHKRIQVKPPLKIINAKTLQPFGTLVDITPDGMNVAGKNPTPVNEQFSLKIVPHPNKFNNEVLEMEVKSMWCKTSRNTFFFNTGYKITNISQKNIERITAFIIDQDNRNKEFST